VFGKKRLFDDLTRAVDMVKITLYLQVMHECSSTLDEDHSAALAAAVVNTVFSEPPTGSIGETFLSQPENMARVREVIGEVLQPRDELRRIVTDAVRVKCTVNHGRNPRMGPVEIRRQCLDPIDRIKELGLLVPGGDSPVPSQFIRDATSFLSEIKTKLGRP